ncbi:(d)CMP kinase [Alkaliphilus serpentinus]|uniref:Cytidylate kinase n=1 Tax=Alkaliphilus serpentinus TaxID=1482731 RepID=A0A833M6T8_9FIRM|nr:(d)CMP kinase [Alkaliphilus serpentinus]KAB3524949.1 (d)CMP kinase [Alkaliphilus serpentinus]
MEPIKIAIDGPAGAGKSTIAQELAKRLKYTYIDTGAMYRGITYEVIKRGIDINDQTAIIELAKKININFVKGDLYIDDVLIKSEIRSNDVSQRVSYIARIPEIREIMVNAQRKIAINQNVVMDGRDIGTNVLVDAQLKLFLTATVEERSRRRYQELKEKSVITSLKEIEEDIKKRDKMDEERSCAPLVMAKDAIKIDTTEKTIEEIIQQIIYLLGERIN